MIIFTLIMSAFALLLILTLYALKYTKNCELSLEINLKGFKFNFKTNETNTPTK